MATTVLVTVILPYHLDLPDGDYSIALARCHIDIYESTNLPLEVLTVVSYAFDAEEGLREDAAQAVALKVTIRLQRLINHLLRWYRHLTGQPDVLEVTRDQIDPFVFVVESTGEDWVVPDVSYRTALVPPAARESESRSLASRLQAGLATGNEPPVGDLNLLDARHAMNTGRFREAVLLAWSVIDSSVVQKFEGLVDRKLAGEWSEAREFLKGNDFGLCHKMTSGFRLVSGFSFAQEADFWKKVRDSYKKRNAVIHEGKTAEEDDAQCAVEVAERVLNTLKRL